MCLCIGGLVEPECFVSRAFNWGGGGGGLSAISGEGGL